MMFAMKTHESWLKRACVALLENPTVPIIDDNLDAEGLSFNSILHCGLFSVFHIWSSIVVHE